VLDRVAMRGAGGGGAHQAQGGEAEALFAAIRQQAAGW
jgi:hypothetical protein